MHSEDETSSRPVAARDRFQRIARLNDSLLDCDTVVGDERAVLLAALERYQVAVVQRDDVARALEALIAEAAR